MPHIHTQPGQHDFTASAFVIRTDDGEPKAMLHMHKKLDRYLQFGGHIELDEDPWQAIIHELREESGYVLEQLDILQPKIRMPQAGKSVLHPYPLAVQTHPFRGLDHFHTDIGYCFIASQAPEYRPHEGESSETLLVSLKDLKDMPNDKIPENVRATFIFAIEQCLTQWEATPAAEYK